eukprot:c23316_g2_i2 orf=136-1638(+)
MDRPLKSSLKILTCAPRPPTCLKRGVIQLGFLQRTVPAKVESASKLQAQGFLPYSTHLPPIAFACQGSRSYKDLSLSLSLSLSLTHTQTHTQRHTPSHTPSSPMLDSSKVGSVGTQSPDVQFRETDGEFLKQQARIWLEAVLGERFDKETSLADVLVDGEILLRVSTVIRNLLRKHADADGEPVSPKSMFPEASFYGKHSGKYLPYSNVDSFLKVCQKLGLTGVDLFSPPDVVEKKDIRRVCSCIRALSKKARARHILEVPEFDYVTHSSVSMPREFVGSLRDSLRQASANNSPSNVRGEENTPDKVGLSPLRMKRPASGLSIAQADSPTSAVSDQLGKEPARSLNFDGSDDTVSAGQQQSVIDPDTPPVAEEDSGFSSGSRSVALSDDEKGPPESSCFDDAGEDYGVDKSLGNSASAEPYSVESSLSEGALHQTMDRGHVSSYHSFKALQEKDNTTSEVVTCFELELGNVIVGLVLVWKWFGGVRGPINWHMVVPCAVV